MRTVSVRGQLAFQVIDELTHLKQRLKPVLPFMEMPVALNRLNALAKTLNPRRGNNGLIPIAVIVFWFGHVFFSATG